MSSQAPNAIRQFPHDRLQPLEDLGSENTETNESVTCRFCQGSVHLKLWRIYVLALGSTWMFQWQNETCPSH